MRMVAERQFFGETILMHENAETTLARDVEAVRIPSGEKFTITEGTAVVITQALGGSFTVWTPNGLSRISDADADALGMEPTIKQTETGSEGGSGAAPNVDDKAVWDQLRTCYDPEIPVNIVDLGLVYDCVVDQPKGDPAKVAVKMTLTAPAAAWTDHRRRSALQDHERSGRRRRGSGSRLGSTLESGNDQRSGQDEAGVDLTARITEPEDWCPPSRSAETRRISEEARCTEDFAGIALRAQPFIHRGAELSEHLRMLCSRSEVLLLGRIRFEGRRAPPLASRDTA
jgi:hypothetical protein